MKRILLAAALFVIAVSAPIARNPADTSAKDPAAAARLVKDGQELYRQGKLGDALISYENAVNAGAEGGELFYQMGYCYKTVRDDADKSRQYMAKAVPFLEKVTADPAQTSITPFYYLSAIYANDLGDAAKGKEVAQRGVALVSKGSYKDVKDGETFFQIGRLYTLAGDNDKALGWYEKAAAALDTGKVTNAQYLATSHEQIAALALKKGDYEKSVQSLKRLMELDPSREEQRLSTGMVLIKAARYTEAIQIMTGFVSDDLGSEANYIVRVLTRYTGYGSPPIPAAVTKMTDEALNDELKKSAAKLSELRQKDDEKATPETAEEAPWTWHTTAKGRKMKVVKRPELPPPDWQPKDPNNITAAEYQYMKGDIVAPPLKAVPQSPERIAAEKEFFTMLTEELRRGHLLREDAVINGYAALIFR